MFNCFEQSAQKLIVLSLNKKRRGGKLGSLWGGEMEGPGNNVARKAVLSLFHFSKLLAQDNDFPAF